MRTVHQLDAKAQMVALVVSQGASQGSDSGDESTTLDALFEGSVLAPDLKVLCRTINLC